MTRVRTSLLLALHLLASGASAADPSGSECAYAEANTTWFMLQLALPGSASGSLDAVLQRAVGRDIVREIRDANREATEGEDRDNDFGGAKYDHSEGLINNPRRRERDTHQCTHGARMCVRSAEDLNGSPGGGAAGCDARRDVTPSQDIHSFRSWHHPLAHTRCAIAHGQPQSPNPMRAQKRQTPQWVPPNQIHVVTVFREPIMWLHRLLERFKRIPMGDANQVPRRSIDARDACPPSLRLVLAPPVRHAVSLARRRVKPLDQPSS